MGGVASDAGFDDAITNNNRQVFFINNSIIKIQKVYNIPQGSLQDFRTSFGLENKKPIVQKQSSH